MFPHCSHISEGLKDRAEANLKALNEFKTFAIRRKTIIGDIAITPYGVSHSAPDSYMFLIECDGKKVLANHCVVSKPNSVTVLSNISHVCSGPSAFRRTVLLSRKKLPTYLFR